MKDKLMELVGESMSACEMIGYAKSGNERANHRATRDKTKAELLAILDGDGDGGAVAGNGPVQAIVSILRALSPHGERWTSDNPNNPAVLNISLLADKLEAACTHPARSGAVSDKGVRYGVISNSTVAKARDAYNNALVGVAISQISAMRAALLAVWPSVD